MECSKHTSQPLDPVYTKQFLHLHEHRSRPRCLLRQLHLSFLTGVQRCTRAPGIPPHMPGETNWQSPLWKTVSLIWVSRLNSTRGWGSPPTPTNNSQDSENSTQF